MSTKHTPGPWAYSKYGPDINDCDVEIWNQNTHIATLNQYHPHHEVDDEANARLIAAAPELLGALKIIIKLCASEASVRNPDMNLEEDIAVQYALQVIAKATGGTT